MGSSPDVLVVGAGAAGIFAAWSAARSGAQVLLLEKSSRIGTKILISGGGKCNIAHAGPLEDVIRAFRPNEARFIRPACYRLTNSEIIELFESRGLPLYARPDGRVFPVDRTAKDVVEILRSLLLESGVEIGLLSPVEEVLVENGSVTGVRVGAPQVNADRADSAPRFGAKALLAEVLSRPEIAPGRPRDVVHCRRVILCCGGSSYPKSGTTGDGWHWARSLGHTVLPLRAALAPIYLRTPDSELSGVALRGCVLKARAASKEVARWTGDLLFTHQGVSGPCALGISREVAEVSGVVVLYVDVVPQFDAEELRDLAMRWIENAPRSKFLGFVEEFMPTRLAEKLLQAAALPTETTASRLDKKSRNRVLELLKNWPIGEVRTVPLELGEVVAGGVALDEVDPKSMASRRVSGLFLCGEILDVAGPVGGYNLQAAFATGFVAGESAARSL